MSHAHVSHCGTALAGAFHVPLAPHVSVGLGPQLAAALHFAAPHPTRTLDGVGLRELADLREDLEERTELLARDAGANGAS